MTARDSNVETECTKILMVCEQTHCYIINCGVCVVVLIVLNIDELNEISSGSGPVCTGLQLAIASNRLVLSTIWSI